MYQENARRKYRSVIPTIGGSVGGFLFLVIGIAMAADTSRGAAGEIAAGVLVSVFGICLVVGVLVDQHIELKKDGLVYHRYLRRKTIPWASIVGFRVGRAPGGSSWSAMVVELSGDEPVVVASLVGTRRFVEHVIAEIEAFRAGLAAARVQGPGSGSGDLAGQADEE
jgi:hypothetical protein